MIRLPVHVADKSRPIDAARRRAGLTCGYTAAQLERTRRLLRPCLSLDQVGEEVDIVDPDEAVPL